MSGSQAAVPPPETEYAPLAPPISLPPVGILRWPTLVLCFCVPLPRHVGARAEGPKRSAAVRLLPCFSCPTILQPDRACKAMQDCYRAVDGNCAKQELCTVHCGSAVIRGLFLRIAAAALPP